MSIGPALIGIILGPILGALFIGYCVLGILKKSFHHIRRARGLPDRLPKLDAGDTMAKALRREFDRRVSMESHTLLSQDQQPGREKQHSVWLSHHIGPSALEHLILFTQGRRFEIWPVESTGTDAASPTTGPASAPGWTTVAKAHGTRYEYRTMTGTVESERQRRAIASKPFCEYLIHHVGWTCSTPDEVDATFLRLAEDFDQRSFLSKKWQTFIRQLADDILVQQSPGYELAVPFKSTSYRRRSAVSDITHAASADMWAAQMRAMKKDVDDKEKAARIQANIELAESFRKGLEGTYESLGLKAGKEIFMDSGSGGNLEAGSPEGCVYVFDGSGGGGGSSGGGSSGGGTGSANCGDGGGVAASCG